jgi:hypothetical protein
MEVRVGKKLAMKKKWSKVNNQKMIDYGKMLVNVR